MSPFSRRRRGRGGQGGHEPRARIRTRELRAIELTQVGWPQHRIASELGVSQPAVSKILNRVEQRLFREWSSATDRHRVRQSLRLEHGYAEAMHAWEQSKADSTRRHQRKTQAASGGLGSTVAEIIVENQHGDPRYLEQARKALADLRTLWGLDAPHIVDVRGSENPYASMDEAALRVELAKQAQLLQPPVVAVPGSPTLEEKIDGSAS